MKLVILDRDGVINEELSDPMRSVAEFHPIPGSLEAIARLCQAGFRVFLASNQPGLGRGEVDYENFAAQNGHLQKFLAEMGGRIDGTFFAPDHPDRAGPMRKPAPGMLLDLAKRLGVSLELVPAVGDSIHDIEAAQAAGARPVLVRTGNGVRTEKEHALKGVAIYDDLAAFASALIAAQQALPAVN
ncbi:HAD-IIIA family hydrolase [Solimonas sp. K1W22B-7]|uniref:D-glycero-alpha-D-manno-heptose-1,7-bisphosphate 7-phosphatase n=1 Tax=Solimonas sp. K1W22B-7 TaxID=2303331 RepID=UPI000E32F22E|nr:HAD-IIIA family hydrolase [Solimonas sp. K1W22B-7]AXQ27378.1 HAD-IIIA family hydrolase [Solimonas sp. K1W22B-7]